MSDTTSLSTSQTSPTFSSLAFFSSSSGEWSEKFNTDHTLVVNGDQEIAVREFIYKLGSSSKSFMLYFDDLKFSLPIRIVYGSGTFTFRDTKVKFITECDHTVLESKDADVLTNLVVTALDKFLNTK